MIYARGAPSAYHGAWQLDHVYDGGAIVYYRQRWFVSKQDGNARPPTSTAWADLGAMGAIPTQVTHSWHPRELRYPCSDDTSSGALLSDPVDVCRDCWLDADLKNAFDPRAHLYVIREPESAMGL